MSLIVQKLGVFIGVFTIKTRKIQHTMLEKLGGLLELEIK